MLLQIFLFELKYRLRRPAFYIYFLFALIFVTLDFGNGAVPAVEKELINAPALLAIYSSAASLFLLLVSSSIMGVPLYRDIEHNTKEYYLSYPITKAGYFWGRWLGSFFFVALISMGVMLGAWLGSMLGPALGWSPAGHYGPNKFYYYLQPWLTLILPNIFFTSCLFFGLVAIFRNVKVIYSSGMFLFLGYLIGNFFLNNINNQRIIYLTDPFLLNGLRAETAAWSPARLNTSVIPLQGLILTNRIIWISVGALILLLTYMRFSFERFFSGAHGRRTAAPQTTATPKRKGARAVFRNVQVRLGGSYFRKTWSSLTRIELLNIIRDNYFWIILSGGLIFLTFVFYHGPGGIKVRDYPRTAFFMDVFGNVFGFFVFFIIIFYTGETVHRERHTRFAYINDALPTPTWILNMAKLASLCCLGIFLSLVPMVVGLGVQLSRSFYYFNLPLYFTAWGSYLLPQVLQMVLFSYAVHNLVNNKFAAHAIGITLWVLMELASNFHYFNYNLLLFGHTPHAIFSDMDSIGHILHPLLWFQGYWLTAGVVLVILSSLFFARGVSTAFREKKQLALEKFQGLTRTGAFLCITVFLAIGGYIYYNVSYLNEYITRAEDNERKAIAERQLKKYNNLPLPRITSLRLASDLYPSEQRATTKAWLTLTNKGERPIDTLLLDGDGLTYDLLYNGQLLSYRNPLSFPRGKFNFLRPAKEPSDYRLYILPTPLLHGDTASVVIYSQRSFDGFQNDLYGLAMLRNGFVFNGGLPALGYDEGEELNNNEDRKKFGLPEKHEADIPHDDPVGRRSLESGFNADLVNLDITVSTAGDQWAVAQGTLEKEWTAGGRHYFHYVQDHPGIYMPCAMASARYAIRQDTTILADRRSVSLQIFYHPPHSANVPRFMAALKDGVRSYSQQFGPYPFGQMRLAEISLFGPAMNSFCQTTINTERVGWNADMREPGLPDNIYYITAMALAEQWWGQTVAPNHTVGSQTISKGVSRYSALMLVKKKYGEEGLKEQLQATKNDYGWGRRTHYSPERDLLHASQWYQFCAKTALVLYGLQGLAGEDSVNAALRSFKEQYAFRNGGDYAGSEDLYRALEAHTPDSFRYFLEDSWQKVCLYNNRLAEASVVPLGGNKFKVTLKLELQKNYSDSSGATHPAAMNDFIDIGIYGKGTLYLQRHRFTAGVHLVDIIVEGKPASARIDPHGYLIDPQEEDNAKPLF